MMRIYLLLFTLVCQLPAVADEKLKVDICVYGGTSGGVAAAVQAARMGKSVALVEPGAHLGGMTSGGLSAVDIGEPRSVGGIAREYFTRLVARYGKELNWGEAFDYGKRGGPATGGAYSIEPHIAEDVFDVMAKEAGVIVWRNAELASVEKDGARIIDLRCADGRVVEAKVFLDTTYEGDLMAAAGVTYTLMREGNAQYGEELNGIHYSPRFSPRKSFEQPGENGRLADGLGVWDRDFPLDPYVKKGDPSSGLLPLVMEGDPGVPGEPAPGVQAYCFRLCLSSDRENFIPIAPPPDYDPKNYELVGRFIEACLANRDDMDLRWFSKHDPLPNGKWDFNTATFGGNLPGLSWDWPEATYAERKVLAKRLENYHRGLFHFLRTDPRVPQKVKRDLARFGLPKDEFTDNGGWPDQVYIREGRRMVSDLVMTEHHTFGRESVKHSMGLGSYGTDAHEIRRIVKDGVVIREGKIATDRGGFGPYEIGYGAIVPKKTECENLLVTFALSASHSAFASIRMEPPFMVTSQSAATAAVHAIDEKTAVQDIDHERLRARLLADGQVLAWDHEKNKPATAAAIHGAAESAAVAVIRAGESQIFVDDVRIASKSGVRRKVHPAAKLDKPVLEAEMPWELGKEYENGRERRVYIYGTVLRDEDSGTFRMWYNRSFRNYLAVSDDGLTWTRPVVDQQGKTNTLPLPLHSPSIILDLREKDPAKRYKALGCGYVREGDIEKLAPHFQPGPWTKQNRIYYSSYSPDGLTWSTPEPALPDNDTITLAQEPVTGEYLAFHKRHFDPVARGHRWVWLSTSRDFKTWSEPVLVLKNDEIDDAAAKRLEGGTHSEYYNLSAFPWAGQWLGLVTHFRRTGRPPVKGPGQSSDDGPIDVQLVHSRDGRNWERCEDRSPVIPLGPHAYDSGSILGLCNTPVIVGDEMWMYYTAMTTTHGGFLPEKQMTIARAAWRLDGMVSLHAGDSEGIIETVPIQPGGEQLIVNADVRSGRLLVEVLDAVGRVVPGYGKSNCLPLSGGGVRQKVAWRDHSSLPEDQPLRLRFSLTGGDLYSYAFEKKSEAAHQRIHLDDATAAKSLAVLREALRARGDDQFWVSMHAAEALTLAGRSEEVRAFLEPMLATETDAQRRCGLARELVRAGDDSKLAILAEILANPDPHGHKHAAESLYKVDAIGDEAAMRRHFEESGDLKLRLMAAAALARQGDPKAFHFIRETLRGDGPDGIRIAAWILASIGNAQDIKPLQERMADASDPLVVAQLQHSLAALGNARGMTALTRNLASDDPAIRTSAATFAGDAGTISVQRKLETMLNDSFPDARVRAAQALLQLSRSFRSACTKPKKRHCRKQAGDGQRTKCLSLNLNLYRRMPVQKGATRHTA